MAYEPKFLLVKWIDARQSDATRNYVHWKAQSPVVVWSCGFGYEKEDCVVLAQDCYVMEPGDSPGDECFRESEIIPRCCITEIVELVVERS